MFKVSRRVFAAAIAVSALLPGAAFAAGPLKEIRIDWATYNPVSMILKQKGLLEKEFAKDGITVEWVLSLGSNKALEFLNGRSICRRSRWKICEAFDGTQTCMLWSAQSWRYRSRRAEECSGPCPS